MMTNHINASLLIMTFKLNDRHRRTRIMFFHTFFHTRIFSSTNIWRFCGNHKHPYTGNLYWEGWNRTKWLRKPSWHHIEPDPVQKVNQVHLRRHNQFSCVHPFRRVNQERKLLHSPNNDVCLGINQKTSIFVV